MSLNRKSGPIEDEVKRPLKWGDLKLLRRLWPFVLPFRRPLFLGAVLILFSAATSLALPYITKLAIDRYVLPTGQKLTWNASPEQPQPPPKVRNLLESQRIRFSGSPGIWFLTPDTKSLLDTSEEDSLIEAGLLSRERYYTKLLAEDRATAQQLTAAYPGLAELYPEVLAIKESNLNRFPDGALMAFRSADLSGLGRLAVIFAFIMFLGYAFEFSQRVIIEVCAQKLSHNLRQTLLGHLFSLSQSFFDRQLAGRLTSRLTNDINNLNNLIKTTSSTIFSDLLSLLGIVGILFYLSPKLALVTLIFTPPTIVLTSYCSGLSRKMQRELRARLAIINQTFAETMGGITVIQAFRQQRHRIRLFKRQNYENYLAGLTQLKINAVFVPLIDFFASCIMALVIWVGGGLVLDETLSLGVVAAFIGYARRFFHPIQDMAEKLNLFQSAFASLERLTELFDESEKIAEHPQPLQPRRPGGAVAFDRVSFRYYPEGPLVLEDLSFRIHCGETVALVGATGSGKSSIINLMLRFYDPEAGEIRFDGQPLKELDLAAHSARLGLVTQDVYLYSGTILENLRLNRSSLTEKDIKAAAEAVGADQFIGRLPHGYNEHLGPGGRLLSTGERQLLACTRALIDTPELVILDEATASVDSETELLLEKALATLFQGRTSIVIAHRLSTIRRADRILVLNRGRLVEEGSPSALLEKKGVFYQLAALQGLTGSNGRL